MNLHFFFTIDELRVEESIEILIVNVAPLMFSFSNDFT